MTIPPQPLFNATADLPATRTASGYHTVWRTVHVTIVGGRPMRTAGASADAGATLPAVVAGGTHGGITTVDDLRTPVTVSLHENVSSPVAASRRRVAPGAMPGAACWVTDEVPSEPSGHGLPSA